MNADSKLNEPHISNQNTAPGGSKEDGVSYVLQLDTIRQLTSNNNATIVNVQKRQKLSRTTVTPTNIVVTTDSYFPRPPSFPCQPTQKAMRVLT